MLWKLSTSPQHKTPWEVLLQVRHGLLVLFTLCVALLVTTFIVFMYLFVCLFVCLFVVPL